MQRSNIKRYEMVPWLFMCLRTSFPSIWFTAYSGSKTVGAPNFPKSWHNTFPSICFETCGTPTRIHTHGSFPIAVPNGVIARDGTSIFILHGRHLTQATLDRPALPSKHTFKLKIINNFKRVTVDRETKLSSLLSTGPCETTQVSAHGAGFGTMGAC